VNDAVVNDAALNNGVVNDAAMNDGAVNDATVEDGAVNDIFVNDTSANDVDRGGEHGDGGASLISGGYRFTCMCGDFVT
jgi:hypothetical protein